MIGMTISPAFVKALGVHAAFELNFNEIDEAGLYDIEWFFALKTAEKIGTLHDQKLCLGEGARSEEHTSELQSHSFISYAVFCLKKKKEIKELIDLEI